MQKNDAPLSVLVTVTLPETAQDCLAMHRPILAAATATDVKNTVTPSQRARAPSDLTPLWLT
jgi:hypothetical protein